LTCHSQVRATRAIAATDEILITYGQHDAAELLRTYGISEGEHAQPAVTLDFRIDEVVDATRTSLAKAGAVLSAATATARCEMLRGAGRLPACFRVRSVNGTLVPTESRRACKCSPRRRSSLDRYAGAHRADERAGERTVDDDPSLAADFGPSARDGGRGGASLIASLIAKCS